MLLVVEEVGDPNRQKVVVVGSLLLLLLAWQSQRLQRTHPTTNYCMQQHHHLPKNCWPDHPPGQHLAEARLDLAQQTSDGARHWMPMSTSLGKDPCG